MTEMTIRIVVFEIPLEELQASQFEEENPDWEKADFRGRIQFKKTEVINFNDAFKETF